MILFSHPTGNANVRQAALGLQRAGLLREFWTCVHYRETPLLRQLLPAPLASQLQRRTFPSELAPAIRTFPWREIGRLLAPRAGLGRLARHESGPLSVDAVYRSLDRRVSARVKDERFRAVYAYEDGAEQTFAEAGRRGRLRIYDLPIGYWRAARALLADEARREPEWAATINAIADSPRKTARKDAELRAADLVVVASTFTLGTLKQAPNFRGTAIMIPYGAPGPEVRPAPVQDRRDRDRLRVLFVGSLGQRKGLCYLFRAVNALRGALDLTVIGMRPAVSCPALDRELAGVRWIPSCSHREVLAEMAAHDVFVFPSLFEGFGLVLLEALAMGLPIITTPHTAGPDLITDGVEGFLVPIRSSEAIAARLDELRREPERRTAMSILARRRAAEFTWERYGDSLAACLATALVRN